MQFTEKPQILSDDLLTLHSKYATVYVYETTHVEPSVKLVDVLLRLDLKMTSSKF